VSEVWEGDDVMHKPRRKRQHRPQHKREQKRRAKERMRAGEQLEQQGYTLEQARTMLDLGAGGDPEERAEIVERRKRKKTMRNRQRRLRHRAEKRAAACTDADLAQERVSDSAESDVSESDGLA
jgi:hypothetical protein